MRTARFICIFALIWLLLPAATARADTFYITAGGETASAIALDTGTDLALLAACNDIDANQPLPSGQLLTLPSQPLVNYTVQSGDTVAAICREFDIAIEVLRALNSIGADNRIYAGQSLLVPLSGELAACTAPVTDTGTLLASRGGTGYVWPAAGIISSRFGWRSRGYHSGLDVAAELGTQIMASRGGVVLEAGWKNDAYGWTVMLSHSDSTETLYAHCSELLVGVGDVVRQGDLIALMGSTGNSTGAHVHFEVRIDGECRDPLDYLK